MPYLVRTPLRERTEFKQQVLYQANLLETIILDIARSSVMDVCFDFVNIRGVETDSPPF